jgi:hypothetical protein
MTDSTIYAEDTRLRATLADLTAANDHTGALIALAEAFEQEALAGDLRAIEKRVATVGHLPPWFCEARASIRFELLARIRGSRGYNIGAFFASAV